MGYSGDWETLIHKEKLNLKKISCQTPFNSNRIQALDDLKKVTAFTALYIRQFLTNGFYIIKIYTYKQLCVN
jgi:hypothetical protein